MMKPIAIRLTEAEHSTISTVARADGRSVAGYVRRLVQEHIGTAPVAPLPEAIAGKGMDVKFEYPAKQDVVVVPVENREPVRIIQSDALADAVRTLRKIQANGTPDEVADTLRWLAKKYDNEPVTVDAGGEEVTFIQRVRRMADAVVRK